MDWEQAQETSPTSFPPFWLNKTLLLSLWEGRRITFTLFSIGSRRLWFVDQFSSRDGGLQDSLHDRIGFLVCSTPKRRQRILPVNRQANPPLDLTGEEHPFRLLKLILQPASLSKPCFGIVIRMFASVLKLHRSEPAARVLAGIVGPKNRSYYLSDSASSPIQLIPVCFLATVKMSYGQGAPE